MTATLTTCYENVQTDDGFEFGKLWLLHPADRFQESRILGVADTFRKPSKLAVMSEPDALAMAARILPGVEIRRGR